MAPSLSLSDFFGTHNVYADVQMRPFDAQGWGGHWALYDRLMDSERPKLVVEVGVWKGATTLHFAKALRAQGLGGKILAVDTWIGAIEFWNKRLEGPNDTTRDLKLDHGFPTVYYTFLSNVVHLHLQDQVIPLPVNSALAARWLREKAAQADLIHIDGAHEYEDVMIDLVGWWPLVKPGGVYASSRAPDASEARCQSSPPPLTARACVMACHAKALRPA